MSLADALENLGKPTKGPRCTMCELIAGLPDDDRHALTTALADPAYSSAGISRALKSEGHRIGDSTVARHRKGECLGA